MLELVMALTQDRPKIAEQFNPADPVQAFARDTVLTMLPAARELHITFSNDGAQRLVAYLTSETIATGIRTLPRPGDAQMTADRRRLVALLLAHAISDNGGLLAITPTSVARFQNNTAVTAGVRSWFCPCWPICRA